MISKKMTDALNEQIKKELYSSYLYLAMSAYCAEQGLAGFAKWLGMQSSEERGHAMKMYAYLQEQGASVKLKAIDEPPAKFGSGQKVFEDVLGHEKFITASICKVMDLAVAEKDYATQGLMQWFINEQVEEESIAADILGKLKMVGGDARGLFMVDRELGARGG